VHEDQFEEKGVTDCKRCHGFDNWGISNFNHNNTAFKLEGRHAEIACAACHKPTTIDGTTFTQYKFDSFQCVDCHQ
jgi:nitrate/TMAO reductase-like tetraheme cytochrome c subunit